jgi:hypothetical protein
MPRREHCRAAGALAWQGNVLLIISRSDARLSERPLRANVQFKASLSCWRSHRPELQMALNNQHS